MMKNAPTFNINDYGPAFHAAVLKRAKIEKAKRDKNYSAQFDTRSQATQLKNFVQGHYAEMWLMNERGFTDCDDDYKDLYDLSRVLVEIKTVGNEDWIEGGKWPLMETCRKLKLETWRNYPDLIYVFVRNDWTGQYTFAGVWEWDKQQEKFIKESKKSLMFCKG